MLIALTQIEVRFTVTISYVIVDGSKTTPIQEYLSQRIKSGGLYHYSISAGSVLAKVTRDRIMLKMAQVYPEYYFDKHVGYGTGLHIQMLKKYGPCPIHRKTYAPIKQIISNEKLNM